VEKIKTSILEVEVVFPFDPSEYASTVLEVMTVASQKCALYFLKVSKQHQFTSSCQFCVCLAPCQTKHSYATHEKLSPALGRREKRLLEREFIDGEVDKDRRWSSR